MNAMIDRLESRKMMSTSPSGPMMILHSSPTTAAPPEGWTIVYDMTGFILLKSDSGERLQLPQVKADGSVALAGTLESDRITVERVTGLSGADDTLALAYFDTPLGMLGINLPELTDPAKVQGMIDRNKQSLADAEKRLAENLAQDWQFLEDEGKSIIESTRREVESARRNVAMAQYLLEEVTTPHDFIKYRLDGFYEVYVEVTDKLTTKSRIQIDAAGGADEVTVANNVPIRTTVTGGAGADKLTSGSKRTLLSGGGGRDRLFSRSRSGGLLAGGTGADRYYNRFGEVQIDARKDGDCLMVNGSPVNVTQPGIFGLASSSTTPGRSYFLTQGGEGQIDLLA